ARSWHRGRRSCRSTGGGAQDSRAGPYAPEEAAETMPARCYAPCRRADRDLSADHALDIAGGHLQRPAAEALTLGPRPAQPRPDPLGDEAPLALGDGGDDGEDRPVERRNGSRTPRSGGTMASGCRPSVEASRVASAGREVRGGGLEPPRVL